MPLLGQVRVHAIMCIHEESNKTKSIHGSSERSAKAVERVMCQVVSGWF